SEKRHFEGRKRRCKMTAISHISDLIGRIAGDVRKENATGAAAIALSATAAEQARLVGLTLHLDAAPTTSESLTITLDANAGAAYDTLLYSLDLSTGSTTDLLWLPDNDIFLETGDIIKVAYANTDTATYGAQLTLLEMS
ncbi:MAG: hypothetical protein DSY80_06255, partial [Desulfocapsa sp.]